MSFSARLSRLCRLFRVVSCAILVFILLAIPKLGAAQGSGTDFTGTGGKHSIQGRIYFPSGRRADATIYVKLHSLSYPEISVIADANGSFGFRSLAPGSYTVIIDAGKDYEIARESVYIETDGSQPRTGISLPSASRRYNVLVHLQPKISREAGPKPGVISATLAEVPAAARDLYLKSLASSTNDDSKKAVEQLKAAIALHPNFPLALNELGSQYMKLGDADRAAAAFHSAVQQDPEAFTPRLNLAIALVEKREFDQAEPHLRQAITRNEGSAVAHLYLGITLISLGKYDEAEKQLLRAVNLGGDNVSLAHYYLGGIYWRKKEYKLAADQLELYLKQASKITDVERIRATIRDLRAKS